MRLTNHAATRCNSIDSLQVVVLRQERKAEPTFFVIEFPFRDFWHFFDCALTDHDADRHCHWQMRKSVLYIAISKKFALTLLLARVRRRFGDSKLLARPIDAFIT